MYTQTNLKTIFYIRFHLVFYNLSRNVPDLYENSSGCHMYFYIFSWVVSGILSKNIFDCHASASF